MNVCKCGRQIRLIDDQCAICEKAEATQPCRSPYCECDKGACTHPGFHDARHEAISRYPVTHNEGSEA